MVLEGFDVAGMAAQFQALTVLRFGESYTHLGIPVGHRIQDALSKF